MAAGLRLNNRQPWRRLVLFAYTVLTVVYLYPYLLHPAGFNGAGDEGLFANAFWWFRHSLTSTGSPFYSTYLFYPKGMNLVFHSDTYSNFLLTLPLQYLWGVEVAVNMAYLFSFILTGYCTYLLVHELTGNKWGAFVAGIIFSFSPFHFGQGKGHLHIATLQWLPLYFFCLNRALRRVRIRYALAAGVVFALIILTDQLQTICAAIVTLIVIIVAVKRVAGQSDLLRRGARQFVWIAVTAGVCSWFYLLPLVKALLSRQGTTKVAPLEHGGANMFSADLLGFVIPGFNRLWGSAFASFKLGLDSVVYLGFISLCLAGYGIWRCRREQPVLVALMAGSFFWVLSLGPYLHLNGIWEFGTLRIPLPYLAMTDIPMLGDNRTPCRFHFMTLLALAVLAGYGVKEFAARLGLLAPVKRRVLLAAVPALILLETIPPRQDPGSSTVPPIYREMGRDAEPYAVLQLPLSRWTALLRNGSGNPTVMMYYQTVHKKPIFGGLASRLPAEDLDFQDNFLRMLVEISAYDNMNAREKIVPDVTELAAARDQGASMIPMRESILQKYGIRYIVLHPPLTGTSVSRAFFEGLMERPFTPDSDGNVAYIKVY